MTFSEISTALQRGESLTDAQKAEAIRAMKGWKFEQFGGPQGFEACAENDRILYYRLPEDRNPFTSVDAALAFVAECFPGWRVEVCSYPHYRTRQVAHTNHVESFWRLFKNSVRSTHIHVSNKYMQRYLGEFTFRSNYRDRQNAMFDLLIAAL